MSHVMRSNWTTKVKLIFQSKEKLAISSVNPVHKRIVRYIQVFCTTL